MNRAYSILTVKSFDDEQRVIRGMATTPSVDRDNEIVDPYGVKVAADIPLFLYHDSKQVVGRAKFGKPTKDGIPFEAHLPHVKEPGRLKDRVDEAWGMVKYRLITGVSIGFQAAMEDIERMKDGVRKFLAIQVFELSLVPVPANAEATISSIKSIDKEMLAASGQAGRSPPGVSGTKQPASGGFFISRQGKNVDVYEIVKSLTATLETKQARMAEIAEAAKEGFSDEQRAEFDVLEGEVQKLQDDLRFKRMEVRAAGTAKPVEMKSAPTILVKKQDPDDAFQGQAMTRLAVCKAIAAQNYMNAADVAAQRYGKSHPKFVQYVKAAVAGGGSDSGEWGAELVAMDGRYTGDFLEYIRSKTIFDKLPLRVVPANVTIKGQDGDATGYWVGQSKGIPASKIDNSTVNLTPLKVAALAVLSNELMADSSPAAEMLVRDSLAAASGQRVDQTFLSATAASSGVSPAGLLNGLSGGVPSGADVAAVVADIQTLYSGFLSAKDSDGIYFAMQPGLAKAISLMLTSLGQFQFPGLTSAGGTLLGDTVVTGDNVTAGHFIALQPKNIWRIGDSGLEISVSREATIEMTDAPAVASDTPVAMGSHAVSMYQTESTAIKVVRRINFQKRRSYAVAFIDNVEYGGVVS